MRIGVFGAGSVGCFIGGMLAAAGNHPLLVGRPAMGARLAQGIVLTGHDGLARNAAPGSFMFSTEPSALAGCECVCVCVKSADTRMAAQSLVGVLQPGCLVVSLQNGITNPALLQELLPKTRVVAGMVGFNIAQSGTSRFHRGTDGDIILADKPGALALAGALIAAGIPTRIRRDMGAVQWGKLLLNLNNAVNALSGLPLKRQLADRLWRKVLAHSMREANAVLGAAGIRPAKLGKVSPRFIPAILELPDWLFTLVAASMLRIDDEARSSMAEDLEKGRQPEIDYLNGEIVGLGAMHGVSTPVNAAIIDEVRKLFAAGGIKHPSATEILARIYAR